MRYTNGQLNLITFKKKLLNLQLLRRKKKKRPYVLHAGCVVLVEQLKK